MSIILNGTTGITTPDITSTTSTLGSLTQALNLGSTGQIVFPATQNASSNANTLDDYEEGTWTPTLYYQNSTGVTRTYTSQDGGYTKIGNTVTVWCYIGGATSNSGSYVNDNIGVTGLPFLSSYVGNATSVGSVAYSGFAGATTVGSIYGQVSGLTAVFIQTNVGAGNLADDLGAGATYSVYLTATYRVA